MRSTAQQITEKLLDDVPLDEWMADWVKNKWNDVKAVTGIGTDSMGLGKNTEKGWKPKYGSQVPSRRPIKRPAPRPQTHEPNKTWDIG